jgi:hypothetical protein
MPELWFAASADRLLYELEADETRRRLFDRINEILSELERDSKQPHLRRHRPHPDIDDAIIIQYVGPSAF